MGVALAGLLALLVLSLESGAMAATTGPLARRDAVETFHQ